MLWNPFLRRLSRLARGRLRIAFLLLCFVLVVDLFSLAGSPPPSRRVTPASAPLNLRGQRIFIASIHRNSEFIVRHSWKDAVANLTDYFGRDSVFVSVYESGSQDDTKSALRDLDFELKERGVHRSIILDQTLEDQIEEVDNRPDSYREGWIFTPRRQWELRRIPYLARLRNKVLEKLDAEAAVGRKYDIVLWLNDVVFTTEDIVTLLATRDGHYDAVCSLDFSTPLTYYDTFALRDSLGAEAFPQTWPYFMSPASRDAVMLNQPVPVQSCWNGVVAFQAEPFYASPPLRFRSVSDSLARHHLEGSECCLIHADFHRANSHGVWLNPNVRVGYKPGAYLAVNPQDGRIWPARYEKVGGMWKNRIARWFGWLRRMTEKWHIKSEVRRWESEAEENHEEALHCLINEMQVLYQNGWLHM